MTRKSRPSPGDGMTARRLAVQRIRVNAQGYDSGGAYWGAGHDVFIATTPDGAEEVTVRARNVAEAREKGCRRAGAPAGRSAVRARADWRQFSP